MFLHKINLKQRMYFYLWNKKKKKTLVICKKTNFFFNLPPAHTPVTMLGWLNVPTFEVGFLPLALAEYSALRKDLEYTSSLL